MGIHHGHVLRILRDGAESRAELARRAKLSATTLTHVSAQLLRDGSILECEASTAPGIGRPAQAVRLAPDAHCVAGVHIGAGNVQVAITDLKAVPKASAAFGFDPGSVSPNRVVEQVSATVLNLAEQIQIDPTRLLGVGIGVPGPVDPARRPAAPCLASMFGWRNVPLADKLEDALRLFRQPSSTMSAPWRSPRPARHRARTCRPCSISISARASRRRTDGRRCAVQAGRPWRRRLGHIQIAPEKASAAPAAMSAASKPSSASTRLDGCGRPCRAWRPLGAACSATSNAIPRPGTWCWRPPDHGPWPRG